MSQSVEETLSQYRGAINASLKSFIDTQAQVLADISTESQPLLDAAISLTSNGKRLRPTFAYCGWLAVGGAQSSETLTAVSSLELLQASALIHDDVMDGSDTRRGEPSVHRRFETLHRTSAWHSSSELFGRNAAILLGDLLLSWTDEMFFSSGVDQKSLLAAKPYLDLMRTEVTVGQYLDILEQARQTADVDTIRTVMINKTAKYTIERPLHLGAAMAGASPEQMQALTHYAIPLGVAFQLRDDVLGVFGDTAVTGKPAGDDLREGKRTMLLARTLMACNDTDADLIHNSIGRANLSDDDIEKIRDIITSSGALAHVENDIERGREVALAALHEAPFNSHAIDLLTELAFLATSRSH